MMLDACTISVTYVFIDVFMIVCVGYIGGMDSNDCT